MLYSLYLSILSIYGSVYFNMKRSGSQIFFGVLRAVVVVFIVFGIGYWARGLDQPIKASEAVKVAKPPTRAELLKLVNAERKKAGVAPLKESAALDKAAQAKAKDETIHGFGHECPGCLNGMLESEKDLGAQGNYGENLTENIHQNTASAAVNAWMNSAPHYQAMVSPRYTLTGFGISNKQVVEEFYSPQQFMTPTTQSFN